MDSEDEYANDDDALGALDNALDEYAAGAPPPADEFYSGANPEAGRDYYDVDTEYDRAAGFAQRAEPSEREGDDDARAYDFPGQQSYDPNFRGGGGGNPMNESTGSQGFGAASTGSLPEEIDVNTHGLIEETVQRLSFIRGVMGVLILDRDGLIVHATMPPQEAAQLTGPALQLLQRARSSLTDDGDELEMLCVRTRKYEMLLCSEMKGAFAVCVVQDPTPEQGEVEKEVVGARSAKIGAAPAGVVF